MKHLACLATLALLCACPTSQPVDAGTPDPGPVDAGFDAGVPDAGPANPYLVTLWDHARITSKQGEPNFQRLTLPLPQLHGGPFSYVTLVADLESTCFPFSKWATTPPPSGQNWPADCDAFDRNYEFMLRTPDAGTLADGGTPPGLELVRAITPFGGPLNLEVDVTDVFNAVDGPRVLEVTIPTWSDGAGRVSGSNGGWFVTARFEVGPGPMPRKVLGVIPLLDLSATSTNRDLQQTFTLPAGTKRTRLEYRVTGHGGATATGTGCIGPAEEFCMRGHVLSADGVELVSYSPWRTDCTAKCTLVTGPGPSGSALQYCQENPCGSINSVRAPRANWCPGSQTPPHVETPATWKTPGDHTFRAVIDTIEPGGLWRITAHVIAYGE